MYMIVKRFRFDAAHWLPGYPGKCANLHGHQWVLEVGVWGPVDPDTGMIMDFADLKRLVQRTIVDRLDHQCLNHLTLSGFPSSCPTLERVAEWIVRELQGELEGTKVRLAMIRLWETDDSYLQWRAQ